MKKLVTLIILNFITINQLLADSRIIGKWLVDDGRTIEVLDGFQVSVGPILITDQEGNISDGYWRLNNDNSISLTIGYSEDIVKFVDEKNFNWGYDNTFTKTGENNLITKISLKDAKKYLKLHK